jgi:hypothetical protein
MPWDRLVSVVNDGQVTLSLGIFNASPVIRALAEAQRQRANFAGELFISIPGTVEDLQTLERYILHANQSDCPRPGEMDLASLITVAELAVELGIPGIAHLVTSDITQVLTHEIDDGLDVKDYPWLGLCHLAKKTYDKDFFDSLAWCFLNAVRATRSQKDALWAFQIGQTVHEETGLKDLWTYGLYLCVAWGAFRHPNASKLPEAFASAVRSNQTELVTMMGDLATPQACGVYDPRVCVGGDVRRRCVDHWWGVWRQAHRVASERLTNEYKGTSFGGAERDVLRMICLISDALQEVTQMEPFSLVSPVCDPERFHASNEWLLGQQDKVRSIINRAPSLPISPIDVNTNQGT